MCRSRAEQGRFATGAPCIGVIGTETTICNHILVDTIGFSDDDATGGRKQPFCFIAAHPFGFAMDRALAAKTPWDGSGKGCVATQRYA